MSAAAREEMNAGFARMERRMDRFEQRMDQGFKTRNRLLTATLLAAILALVVHMTIFGHPVLTIWF